jgi:NAD(P)-dependent dehydrogenase (short-subunit alcohol dehydrogenase family)
MLSVRYKTNEASGMQQSESRVAIERRTPPRGNRSAIVTGGASGIGRALAEELARAGVYVVLADRQVDLAEQVAVGIRAHGGAGIASELDVRDPDRFRAVVQTTVAEAGCLDYLFNNAGIAVAGEMRDYNLEDWQDVFDVNLRGVWHGILAAYPLMIEQGFGHIVNTASLSGLIPALLQGSYTATKHAVVGLSRALRIEAQRYGVKVSVLCPGAVRTPILRGGRYGRVKSELDVEWFATRIERLGAMEPSLLARRVLRAVRRNRAIIIEPRSARITWYLDRLSPWLSEKLWQGALGLARRASARNALKNG